MKGFLRRSLGGPSAAAIAHQEGPEPGATRDAGGFNQSEADRSSPKTHCHFGTARLFSLRLFSAHRRARGDLLPRRDLPGTDQTPGAAPPSIANVVPLIYGTCPDTTKRTSRASSSGEPKRRIGTRCRSAAASVSGALPDEVP